MMKLDTGTRYGELRSEAMEAYNSGDFDRSHTLALIAIADRLDRLCSAQTRRYRRFRDHSKPFRNLFTSFTGLSHVG